MIVTDNILKGGATKTTSVVHATYCLAKYDIPPLLVDMDRQGSATKYLGLNPNQGPSLYHVFAKTLESGQAIQHSPYGVDVLTGNTLLSAVEAAMESNKDEGLLAEILAPLRARYKFIFIDSPPGCNVYTDNALVAADLVMMPASAEKPSLDGISDLILHLRENIWGKFKIDHQDIKMLFTRFKPSTSHSPGVVQEAKTIWGGNVLDMIVPEAIEFSRAYDKKMPLNHYWPDHPGAIAYDQVAKWLIEYEKTTTK